MGKNSLPLTILSPLPSGPLALDVEEVNIFELIDLLVVEGPTTSVRQLNELSAASLKPSNPQRAPTVPCLLLPPMRIRRSTQEVLEQSMQADGRLLGQGGAGARPGAPHTR